jgi:hypothetical protein
MLKKIWPSGTLYTIGRWRRIETAPRRTTHETKAVSFGWERTAAGEQTGDGGR